ncbi:membrane dipeptidase [Anaerolineae bacterium]|nr:membrane dipeptidase [Anaerolineae bacterium]
MPTIPSIILDAHQDIAWNKTTFGRDFTQSALLKRSREINTPTAAEQGGATCGLPEALLGRVGVIFGTIFAPPAASTPAPWRGYQTPQEAYRIGMEQIDVYHRLADTHPQIALIRTQKELDSVLDTWQEGVPFEKHQVGIVILMEGADPILEPRAFAEWYEYGVRLVGPAWGQTRYSGGTRAPGRLTPQGRELLEVMASYKAILDLSHMAEESYLEAVDSYEGTIIASHSNPRRFCDTDRHLSDDMIRRLIARDGVIGTVLYNRFMWHNMPLKADALAERIAEIIDYVCQLAGSARHVGIGSDWDGGFGVANIPASMDTIADLRLIRPLLSARGYSATDMDQIENGNFLRILRAALP